jgi:hypothetical protein
MPASVRTVRLILSVLGVGVVVALCVITWSSTATRRGEASIGPPTLPAVRAAHVHTITVHGRHAGYEEAANVVQTETGASTVTRLELHLSTEATPASAPSAAAKLTGAKGFRLAVPLTVVGAGIWTSRDLEIPAGRYVLSTRFDRNGGPVTLAVTINVG